MKFKTKISFFIIFLQVVLTLNSFGSINGKDLFKENCASCHEIGRILTGPDLNNINSIRTNDWLIDFITDSKKLIDEGEPISNQLYEEYQKVEMPPSGLNKNEILAILEYIEDYEFVEPVFQSDKANEVKTKNKITPYFLIILILGIVLLILTLTLYPELRRRIPISFYLITSLFIIIALIFGVGKYWQKIESSNPPNIKQEVEFNHQIHYVDYQIDCIYCHEKALNFKMASLPQLSNCMKCHDYIKEGESYGKDEIDKLFTIENEQREINWLKGYRLSEHVHFNHGLHVQSAGISCTDCHENIENPTIKKTTVAMKWCIDCHKQQSVNISLNYYKNVYDTQYYSIGLTASNNGSNNCSVCHY